MFLFISYFLEREREVERDKDGDRGRKTDRDRQGEVRKRVTEIDTVTEQT